MPLDYTKPSQEICPRCEGYCCVEYSSKFVSAGALKDVEKCPLGSHKDWNCYVCPICRGNGWIGAKLMPVPKIENPTARQLANRRKHAKDRGSAKHDTKTRRRIEYASKKNGPGAFAQSPDGRRPD